MTVPFSPFLWLYVGAQFPKDKAETALRVLMRLFVVNSFCCYFSSNYGSFTWVSWRLVAGSLCLLPLQSVWLWQGWHWSALHCRIRVLHAVWNYCGIPCWQTVRISLSFDVYSTVEYSKLLTFIHSECSLFYLNAGVGRGHVLPTALPTSWAALPNILHSIRCWCWAVYWEGLPHLYCFQLSSHGLLRSTIRWK